jgi:hypothetical protein
MAIIKPDAVLMRKNIEVREKVSNIYQRLFKFITK